MADLTRRPFRLAFGNPLAHPNAPAKGGGGVAPAPDAIRALFENGEAGWVRIPGSSYGTSYQERTGASAATVCSTGSPVGTYYDDVTGGYWTASADARRPIYTVSGGLTYHDYDGTDDCLVGPTIDLTGTDVATHILGVECDTGSAAQVITEFSAVVDSNNGSFVTYTRASEDGNFAWLINSGGIDGFRSPGGALPRKAVVLCVFDRAGAAAANRVMPRINGVAPSLTSVSAAGSAGGNFGNYVPYSGARGNASLRLNGRVFADICVGRELTTDEIASIETIVAGLSGVTL